MITCPYIPRLREWSFLLFLLSLLPCFLFFLLLLFPLSPPTPVYLSPPLPSSSISRSECPTPPLALSPPFLPNFPLSLYFFVFSVIFVPPSLLASSSWSLSPSSCMLPSCSSPLSPSSSSLSNSAPGLFLLHLSPSSSPSSSPERSYPRPQGHRSTGRQCYGAKHVLPPSSTIFFAPSAFVW